MTADLFERLQAALADRYAVESEIGRGGMATVFLAEDLKHHRKVAIKVLHPELAASLGTDRFLREIQIAAQLEHPHIVALIDSGEAAGLPYYVMPFVEGESLRARLEREGPLPVDQALQIATEVADGLHYAHEHGVVHRDIKPGNILLSAGHARIADFGVARALGAASEGEGTLTGLAVGTPKYMSPEQAAGGEVDGRADVYALGCVLWEMLAGEPPFDGPTPHAILARKAAETVPDLRVRRKSVPADVESVIARAMAPLPVDRFETAGDFAAALKEPGLVGAATRRRRVRGRVLSAGVAIVLLAAGVWLARLFTSRPAEDAADEATLAIDPNAIAVLPFQVIGADSASAARLLAQSVGNLFELKVTGEFGRRIAHPGSVAERWRQAGGTPDTALSEAAELQLGRDLGVGALVRGTVVEADSGIVLAASMVDVLTGETRVRTVRAEGRLEERFELVDRLIVLLLSRDGGYSAAEAPRLAQFKPEAIQAYLAAFDAGFGSREQNRHFHAALAADSSLVDAALWAFAMGETDTTALRYAWENRDQLTERGRAYLQVLAAGRYGSVRTMAEAIAGWEALARRWPEWNTPWIELGQALALWGPLASEPDWRRRAREALEHVDEPGPQTLWSLTELAFMERDTARARDLVARFQAYIDSPSGIYAGLAGSYPWRLAILEGDTAAATQVLADTPDSLWSSRFATVRAFALADGRGVVDADRVVLISGSVFAKWFWGWARGREQEWQEARQQAYRAYPTNTPVFEALLLGSSEDTLAAEAVRDLENQASGRDGRPGSADDRAHARCWIALWRLEHGDTTGVRKTLSDLGAEEDRTYRFAGWKSLLDVLLTRLDGGDVHAALLRSDSVVRELPLPTGFGDQRPLPAEVQNLMLARLLREYGEPERALVAIRRRIYYAPNINVYISLPEYLREEALLAATVGDTAGAIEAYRHYFTLRDVRPDQPTWAAQWDSMRVEYGALTAVEGP